MMSLNSIQIHKCSADIAHDDWRRLLAVSRNASFFQSPECYDFYESLSFLKPFVFAVSESDRLSGLVCGYIIADGGRLKRLFSRRAIVPSGILLCEDISEKALKELLTYVVSELKKEAIYIEIRNHTSYNQFKSVFKDVGFRYEPHLNYQLDIASKHTVWDGFSKSKRRQIRQAQQAGVYWEAARESEDIKQFYTILSRLYAVRVRRPLFPIEFFMKLASSPNGKLLVVKKNGTVIGGMACVVWNGRTLYEWFVCGVESAGHDYPSVMATWAGIEYACEQGLKTFDFMGAGTPDKEYGVREFKSKFGGELVENGRFVYISSPLIYNMGKLFISVKSR